MSVTVVICSFSMTFKLVGGHLSFVGHKSYIKLFPEHWTVSCLSIWLGIILNCKFRSCCNFLKFVISEKSYQHGEIRMLGIDLLSRKYVGDKCQINAETMKTKVTEQMVSWW